MCLQAKWLWRTLHAAELAGQDAEQVLTAAIAERDLVGARDVPSVLDARIRHRVNPLIPLPARPWPEQVPEITYPEQRFTPLRSAEPEPATDVQRAELALPAGEGGRSWI
jgi:hypothetical protein